MYDATAPMVSVTDARAHLREILARVKAGEEITLTQNGDAVALLVPPDRLRARRRTRLIEEAEEFGRRFDAMRKDPPPLDDLPGEGLTSEYAARLIAEVRAARDRD